MSPWILLLSRFSFYSRANHLSYAIGMNPYRKADGECFLIMKGEHEGFDADKNFNIASLRRFPSLFLQMYYNKADALHELKENFGEFLPKDFDYESRFVHYLGTYLG